MFATPALHFIEDFNKLECTFLPFVTHNKAIHSNCTKEDFKFI